jgi:hypothetical protein
LSAPGSTVGSTDTPLTGGDPSGGSRSRIDAAKDTNGAESSDSQESLSLVKVPDAFLFEATGLAEAYRAILRRAREIASENRE